MAETVSYWRERAVDCLLLGKDHPDRAIAAGMNRLALVYLAAAKEMETKPSRVD
jgi:hypothetical protein